MNDVVRMTHPRNPSRVIEVLPAHVDRYVSQGWWPVLGDAVEAPAPNPDETVHVIGGPEPTPDPEGDAA